MHKDDESKLLFTSQGVHVTLNRRMIGDIADPHSARLMLAIFIGESPTPRSASCSASATAADSV